MRKILFSILTLITGNIFIINKMLPLGIWKWFIIILFALLNIKTPFNVAEIRVKWLKSVKNACEYLESFLMSVTGSIVFSVMGFFGFFSVGGINENFKIWLINSLIIFLVELIVFWNGMIRVYLSSKQLGIRWRFYGLLCGMVPVVNLIMLFKILKVAKMKFVLKMKKLFLMNNVKMIRFV